MEYCGNCGEAAQGRYCRMCGAPVGTAAAATADGQATQAVAPGYAGYGAAYEPAPATESTQAMAAAMPAGYAMSTAGPEPTQMLSPMPTPPTQPPTEFDSLFRNADGSPGTYGQTQLLPPIVETDYRMQPPGGAPPSGAGGFDGPGGQEPRTNRTVLFATLGAVLVVAGIIFALVYIGNQSGGSTAGSSAVNTPAATGAASQAPGQITVPTNAATVPSASASTATTAASTAPPTTSAAFSGDSFPLGPGSQGSWVKWVQQRLQQLGYYHGSISGTFDQATALAVQQFQGAAGVTGDPASTVGQHTRLALTAAGSTPSLRFGSHSADISRLNQALDLAEGASLSGGKYSMQTAEAVAVYQQAVGLQPTGQVDAATWAKLQTGTLAD